MSSLPIPAERGEDAPTNAGAKGSVPGWVLKKLTTRHKRIVALKAAGLERHDIAKMVGCTPEYVSMLLAQKLVREYLGEKHREIDDDLRDLMGPAVGAIRATLDSPDDKVRLNAAALVLKTQGKMSVSDDSEGVTAEDIVARLFSISNSNVQINLAPPPELSDTAEER